MPLSEYAMWQERARTGKNSEELEKAYGELMRSVKRIDPLTIAEATDGKYRADGVPGVHVTFLHSWFVLDLLPYRVRAGHSEVDTLPMKVLMLQHLIAAAENQGTAVRVMGKWIDCRSLHDGAFMGAHFAGDLGERLARFFALERHQRLNRVFQWAGKPLDLGDDAFVFKFFPRLPVAFVHWRGDEEFDPYSKILYDVSASNYMPTHGLRALTEFLVQRLVGEE
jgi:hypothetical protein